MTRAPATVRAKGGEAAAQPERRRFTIDEYYRMGETGILREDERVELLEGDIICMSPIGGPHMACVNDMNRAFSRALGDRAIVSVQNPVRLSPYAEPVPDLTLLRPRPDGYRTGVPGPGDVLLLVEIADTTLRLDRDRKLPLYAAAGIPEVWIADPRGKRFLVHREPQAGIYQQAFMVERGGALSPAAFPDIAIDVAEILG